MKVYAPNAYPRESTEFVFVEVAIDNVLVTSGVELAVTQGQGRPLIWNAATAYDGGIGLWMTGFAVGSYKIWARVTASPEFAVDECGYFSVT